MTYKYKPGVSEESVWEDLRVPINAIKLGGVNDPNFVKLKDNGSGSTGVFTYRFDNASEEEVFFVCQIPHNWKQGTDLRPHVHWCPVSTDPGVTVVWGLEYTFSEIGGVYGNTSTVTGSTTRDESGIVSNLVAFTHYFTELSDIDMSGVESVSSMLVCRLYRKAADAGDTYTDDAALLEFDFHYEIDSDGSRTEYIK